MGKVKYTKEKATMHQHVHRTLAIAFKVRKEVCS